MDECQNVITFNDIDVIDDATATDCLNMGQSESKKNAKRTGPETKGTAMSFGFKKKLYSNNKKNETKEKEKERLTTDEKFRQTSTVISNPGLISADYHHNNDDNGNRSSTDSLNERETGRTTPRLVPPKKESTGGPYRSIRFGFRQSNVVRPASTGLSPTVTTYDNAANNNISVKPRSKSASNSSRSITPIGSNQMHTKPSHQSFGAATNPTTQPPQQYYHQSAGAAAAASAHTTSSLVSSTSQREQPKIAPVSTTVNISYQQLQQQVHAKQPAKLMSAESHHASGSGTGNYYTNKPPSGRQNQYTVINTGMHTNEIIRPIPQSASPSVTALVTKFTLHTSSLPKPQYPVPINLAPAAVPVSPSHRYAMDTKIAKQTANNNRRGFRGPRDISTDSGISSLGNNYYSSAGVDNHYGGGGAAGHTESPKRHKNKPRNFEMVINGRHKFDVRELEDSLSDDNVMPLSLPQLPSAFNASSQPAPLSGLIRHDYNNAASRQALLLHQASSDASHRETAEDDSTATLNYRKSSFTSLDVDSIEEEKVYRDNSTSEKSSRNLLKEYSPSSKNSSPVSSRASWCNAGESMAFKDCSSMSVSSCDSVNNKDKALSVVEDDEDGISSMAITHGNNSFLSSISQESPPAFSDSIMRNNMLEHERVLSIDIGNKFAEITASVDDMFLDDETSPTDSLVSSTDSDEIISKKNKKKINDSIKEKFLDDISPILEVSCPLSPGTPTHATNSLSMSDEGRDFLIDDEIADQPALCFADNHEIAASTQHLHSLTDTPTLIETTSTKSNKSRSKQSAAQQLTNNNNSYAPQVKPRQSLLSRTESLDTLSPCESIASDDLMMDFECHSSVDSIDRMCQSVHSGSGSALHSLDETQLWSELEQQGGEVLREWSTLLRSSRQNSRDTMISQLPARATRLLNRSRIQHSSNPGSESPRSLDSFSRKTPPRPSPHLMGRESMNSSDDNIFMLDKSLRNTMIQDVLYFKKQLIRLRSILQEPEEECLTRTDTLNPFEINNGQFFGTGGFDSSSIYENKDLYNISTSQEETKHELADLRRQVVYLQDELSEEVQSQMDDKDRTIRIQQTLIDKLETEIDKGNLGSETPTIDVVDTVNTATQTERVRPISMATDGSRLQFSQLSEHK